ncbi:MFS transporter [Nocardiopsis sp. MG754419]|uniref:MFS transporter n=1 Tax=Nocardiopsis sp. MG754419 TaxID=2259865 RepID=UPI001BA75EDD|nr:MFS transporter [Nocardiopsis sp. MG754419]MBR8742597.1 MFS transporter [Nocardiopsis sp. MG754419]
MRPPPLWLLALTLAAFTVQTDDFVILGVLPALAADMGVSEAAAGQLVTVYSLVYAVAAPLWALALARVPRRGALVVALGVFVLANLAVPAVDDHSALLTLRVVAALAAAVVLPVALAVASTEAPTGRRGRYLATVMTGLTGAVLVGVPAGTWIGAVADWQATFVTCGLLGLLALVLVACTLPATSSAPQEVGARPPRGLRPDPVVLALLLVTVLVVAGNLGFQTYLAPFLAGLADVGPRSLAVLLVVSGVGGLVGTRYAGALVDRIGARRGFLLACGVFCLTMVVLALAWPLAPVPVVAVAIALVCWSAAAWAVPPTLQALLLDRVAPAAATWSLAILSSAVYVGAALGGAVGGLAVAHGAGLVPLVAAVVAATGLALAVVLPGGGRADPEGAPDSRPRGPEHGGPGRNRSDR